MIDFAAPLVPLTRRQRAAVFALGCVLALTRLLAVARSLWEWDEVQFLLAMRDFDVTRHQPHPPGFPVFIALGKLLSVVAASDFRALQSISVVAGMLAFPAVFLLARELRFGAVTSAAAAALFVSLPNVLYFGGTAFSDVPSIVLVLFACVYLLRGTRGRGAYWTGTILLALAAGIRPQNLVVGLFPGLIATRKRTWKQIVTALLLGVIICSTAFGAAIYATGDFDRYMTAVRQHGDYISRIDSWRSPNRPPLWRIFDRFFLKQYQSPPLSAITSIFVITSVVGAIRRRDSRVLSAVLTFAPFAFMAWLMLDRYSISRFSIGYAPLFAIMAGDGMRRAGEAFTRSRQNPADDRTPHAVRIEIALATVLSLAFLIWTIPALRVVRTEDSPTVRALAAVRKTIDPRRDRLYVGHTMTRYVDYLAPSLSYRRVMDDRALPLSDEHNAWLLAEITDTKPEGEYFRRERGHLWNIARRNYFEIVLAPLKARAEFLDGWYAAEWSPTEEWRWMSGRGIVRLPAAGGPTILRMHFTIPAEVLAQNPEVTISLDGSTLERFTATDALIARDYRVTGSGAPATLEMTVSRTYRPPDESRDLGLRLQLLSWGPH